MPDGYKISKFNRWTNRVIYTLSNPVDNKIFYVGVTCDPLNRFRQHRKVFGFTPIMEELEMLNKISTHGSVCNEESYWIDQLRVWGFDLTNVQYNYKYVRNA
jgi:predicted GIY-YIG superfamily endonuclease